MYSIKPRRRSENSLVPRKMSIEEQQLNNALQNAVTNIIQSLGNGNSTLSNHSSETAGWFKLIFDPLHHF